MDDSKDAGERAIVAVVAPKEHGDRGTTGALDADSSLDELAELADTAGAEVVGRLVQWRDRPSASHYFGRGRVDELAAAQSSGMADLLICDDELRPVQKRNLERETGLRVIDRTELILDIFAQRARTREGRLQVELAQLRYLLPRLAGTGSALSRLGGGIGTRGPGETRLEQDRRRINDRIAALQRQLEDVRRARREQRRRRAASKIPTVGLVGYTNAGKSTLMRALSAADAAVEDRLFATLDPLSRRVRLPDGRNALFTDTVGFIRKLPHQLVAAFRATLEEVGEADLLIHVLDVSHEHWPAQYEAVREVLSQLGAADTPTVVALNKSDLLSPFASALPRGFEGARETVLLSARTGEGIDELLRAVEAALSEGAVAVRLEIPYDQGAWLRDLHERAHVLNETYTPAGIEIEAEVERWMLGRLRPFLQAEPQRSR